MSKWVRVTSVIDLRMDEGDTVQSTVNALTEGMMEAKGEHTRVISLEAHEVEDAPKRGFGSFTLNADHATCPCRQVIG